MYHCITKVMERRNKLLHIGVVVDLKRDYKLDEMVDAIKDLEDAEDDKALTMYTCTVEIAGDEKIVPVKTILVSKAGKEQLQQVIYKMQQLYSCSQEGFIKNYGSFKKVFSN